MIKIDFDKELTYARALLIPFAVAPFATVVNTINSLIKLAFVPATVLLTAYFINTALLMIDLGLSLRIIILPLILLALFKLYDYLVDPLLGLMNKKASQKYWYKMEHPLMQSRASLKTQYEENSETKNLADRVWNGNDLVGIWDTFVSLIFSSTQMIIYMVIFLVSAPIPALIVILPGIPLYMAGNKIGQKYYEARKELTKPHRLQNGYSWYLNDRNAVNERQLFSFTPMLQEMWMGVFEHIRKVDMNVQIYQNKVIYSKLFIENILTAISLLVMLHMVISGSLSVGMYIAIMGMMANVLGVHGMITGDVSLMRIQKSYLDEYNAYCRYSRVDGANNPMATNVPAFSSLEFKNVSFSYPGRKGYILKNCSFVLQVGRRYSIVGANGSGKTTLVKLILKFYENYEGEIFLNQKSLKEWPLPVIKAMFSAAFQDFVRYDISIADNVAVGGGMTPEAHEVAGDALEIVGLKETIEKFPNGMDTMLGKVHEGGVEPSTGQWHRIAIARTVASNAQLRILDEPTAALDPMAESEVYAQFDQISKGFTTIFISHRLASAKIADTIFVLDEGKIVEQGSHAELMNMNGLYAKMYQSQREWYL